MRAPRPRGAAVEEAVLAATLEELAAVGYQALRFERVAARAGVARTTVYRRWPSRGALVRAAIEALPGAAAAPPARGSLRDDLIELGLRTGRFAATPHGLAVLRLFVADGDDAELRGVLDAIRRERDDTFRALLEGAQRRGEIPREADLALALEVFPGALLARALLVRRPVARGYVTRLVDLLLRGLGARPVARSPR